MKPLWLCYCFGRHLLIAWFWPTCPIVGRATVSNYKVILTEAPWWNSSILLGVVSSRMPATPYKQGSRAYWMVWSQSKSTPLKHFGVWCLTALSNTIIKTLTERIFLEEWSSLQYSSRDLKLFWRLVVAQHLTYISLQTSPLTITINEQWTTQSSNNKLIYWNKIFKITL